MKLIRCLSCNKVLGEVEGKAKIKCKMAGCHCMNVIDTVANIQWREPNSVFGQGIIEPLIKWNDPNPPSIEIK